MIRFIDLRGQIFLDDPSPYFAFYDTVHDRFLMDVDGAQAWESFEEFKDRQFIDDEMFTRCRELCPSWAKED